MTPQVAVFPMHTAHGKIHKLPLSRLARLVNRPIVSALTINQRSHLPIVKSFNKSQ